MKKLSLLVALMLVVTIGGVYATWNYAQGNVAQRDKYLTTHLTDKVVDNAKGSIDVNIDGLTLTIDDSDNNHYGELSLTGEIVITFTPNTGADEEVTTNGIPLQYVLSVTDNYSYLGEDIFTVVTTPQVLNTGNATKSITISANELKTLITLNDTYLPTVDDYTAFKTALHSGSIGITVSEYVAP